MAHIRRDRVQETTTTTGTGTLALAGAVAQFKAFSAVMANNDTTIYAIVGQTGTEWEVGLGTWTTGNNLARTTILASSNADAVVTLSAGTKNVFMSDSPVGLGIILPAGTATIPSLKLAAGTLLTTAEAGAIELDATNLYAATDAGNRGIIPVVHFLRADATRTLPNDTNLNAIFNSPANGTLTLETGTYRFNMLAVVTAMSTTSGNALINIRGAGSATIGAWLWRTAGLDTTGANTISGDAAAYHTSEATAASAVTAAVNTVMRWHAHGSFEVTGAGTIIPSIDLVTAIATAVVAVGSFFECWRIGSTSVTSVGQWT